MVDELTTILTRLICLNDFYEQFIKFCVFLQRLLNSFVNRLFTASSFEADFPLIKVLDEADVGAKKITMPDGIRYC